MGFASRGITSADILAAIVDDSTRYHGASIAAILAGLTPKGCLDFWSDPVDIVMDNSAADKALGDVVLPNIPGITIIAAYALFKADFLHNTALGGNGLITATYIQIDESASGYINAIEMNAWVNGIATNDSFPNAIGTVVGNLDLTSLVTAMNLTINFKWALARVNSGDLLWKNCRTGIRVIF